MKNLITTLVILISCVAKAAVGDSVLVYRGNVVVQTNLSATFSNLVLNGSLSIRSNILATQIQAPATAVTSSSNAAAGNLLGTYYYRVTFVTATGETECGPLSSVLAITNAQVDLSSIPTSSDSRVLYRNIYRSKGTNNVNVYPESYDSPLVKYLVTISNNIDTTYTDNTADSSLGSYSKQRNTTGGNISLNGTNVFEVDSAATLIGYNAGGLNAYGSERFTAIGKNAGANAQLSFGGTFIGEEAGLNNGGDNGGDDNTFIGNRAGKANTLGLDNVFVGQSSGESNTTGVQLTFLGEESGRFSSTGSENVFVGQSSGAYNGTGMRNTYVGTRAGGRTALALNVNDNVLIGRYAGDTIQSKENVIVGSQAAQDTVAGEKNVMVGFAQGYYNITGSRNVWLGHYGSVLNPATDLTNTITIGYDAKASNHNSVVIGNSSITNTYLKGRTEILGRAPVDALGTTLIVKEVTSGDTSIQIVGTVSKSALQLTSGGLSIWTDNQTGGNNWVAGDEKMKILTGGNVGIGITTPTEKLHVSGNSATTGTNYTGYLVVTNNSSFSQTNYISELVVTNGVTIGGERRTTWPSGGGSSASNAIPFTSSYVDASNVWFNAGASTHFNVTLTNTVNVLNAPTNAATDGQRVTFRLIQDSSGNRPVTMTGSWRFGTDITAITCTTNANKADYMGAMWNSLSNCWDVISFVRGY